MRLLALFVLGAVAARSGTAVNAQEWPDSAQTVFATCDAADYPAPIVGRVAQQQKDTPADQFQLASLSDSWPPTTTAAAGPGNSYEEAIAASPPTGTTGNVYPCFGTGDVPRPVCDACPTWGVVTFVSYDDFRGITDSSWSNDGVVAGANFGTKLGPISDLTGFGFQVGGSVGVFDWSGTDYRPVHDNAAEVQGFITYGFFHKPNENSRWRAAVVQDWMLNDNYGVYGENPTLSQLRAELGYAINEWNEIGFWGTCRVLSSTRYVAGDGLTQWRPIDQVNLYWHYKWQAGGADTIIWIGLPEQDRLGGGSAIGDYIAGAAANVPLNDWFGLYTLVTYMHPSGGAGPAASEEDGWNFTIGVTFYPGRNARSSNVAGQCWMPDLPVANNGYFFVDTNHHNYE